MLEHVNALSCGRCGSTFRPAVRSACPTCADGGSLRFSYALDAIRLQLTDLARREPWLWRYKELLPFEEPLEVPPLQVGMTPLYGSARLAAYAGVAGLLLKDESRNPSARVGDRAASVIAAHARDRGLAVVTHRLARPLASVTAAAEVRCAAVVRDDASADALEGWGLQVLAGWSPSRAELVHLAQGCGRALGDWPNPLMWEGLKTLGLELGEQLAERLPQWVVVDGADEGLAEATALGFGQLRGLGLIGQIPALLVANAEAVGEGPWPAVRSSSVEVTSAQAQQASHQIRCALGLPIDADGAVPLAAARVAREAGLLKGSEVVAVVAQGAPPFPVSRGEGTSACRQGVRSFDDVASALRG